MRTLDVWLEAFDSPVGRLTSDEYHVLSFVYYPEYTAQAHASALSMGLPLEPGSYGDAATRAFFSNLLMEGGRLDEICAGGNGRPPIDRNDIVAILDQLGRECPGAVSAVPPGAPPGKKPGLLAEDYLPISGTQLAADLANLYKGKPARSGTEISLAGVQSKMAVTMASDGTLMEPKPGSGAPTTHILKVGNWNIEGLVANEFLCLKLAKALGLAVVDCAMHTQGGIDYLLVPRYDRIVDYAAGTIRRLHQEDCCQALGLPPTMKYERQGDRISGKIADFVRLVSLSGNMAAPADYRAGIAVATFFNYLVGNTDAHAKNFSLLYDGTRPKLADLYDIINVSLYPRQSQEFAMGIGGSLDGTVAGQKMWDSVREADWMSFLAIVGFKGAGARRFLERVLRPLAQGARPELERLVREHGSGLLPAQQISDCLSSRIAHLNKIFGWDIPVDAGYGGRLPSFYGYDSTSVRLKSE